MSESIIKHRCVISVGDYEPIGVAQQFANFQKGLRRFDQTWNITSTLSPFKTEADGTIAVWHTETTAPTWKVKTEFRFLNWSDLFENELSRWSFGRVWRSAKALTNFVVTGTCWHYFRLNWRFGLLFLYPVLAALFFAIIGYWLAGFLSNFDLPLSWLVGFAAALALFIAFIKKFDPHTMARVTDLWILLHHFVHREETGLPERLGIFIQDTVTQLELKKFDEILIIGHGLGAALQPVIVDRAFWAMPEFGKDGRSVSLLSLGSLLLAVGVHPEGAWVVPSASRVARDRMVYWAEYQLDHGIIGFPDINSVTELLDDHDKPVLQKIELGSMIDIDAKRRLPDTIFENHRQLVQPNAKKYFYDYFMICCGPYSLPMRVKSPDLMVAAFKENGRPVSSQERTLFD